MKITDRTWQLVKPLTDHVTSSYFTHNTFRVKANKWLPHNICEKSYVFSSLIWCGFYSMVSIETKPENEWKQQIEKQSYTMNETKKKETKQYN